MKAFFLLMALSSSAFAQDYINDPYTPRPPGATGPGVYYSQTVTGQIIGVGSQIIRNVPTAIVCPENNPQGNPTHSALNTGTVIGAVTGGVIGSRFGDGNGKKAATAAGVVAGGIVGNAASKARHDRYQTSQNGCETVFETRIVGWTYTATYGGLQVQGTMRGRLPQLGENVNIILVSTIYTAE